MTAGLERRGRVAAEGEPAADSSVGAQRGDDAGAQWSAAGVLADRMAAALVHREPGWKLPRRSALARRFNVSVAEIDVAVEELARRSLLRKLPDGQLYRASPAEYRIPIEGVTGLTTSVDPMGSAIVCRARHVSRRRAPQDIGWALGLAPGTHVRVIRCLWTAGGDPAAMSTAYLPEPPGSGGAGDEDGAGREGAPGGQDGPGGEGEPSAEGEPGGEGEPASGPAGPGWDDNDGDWMPAFDTVLNEPPRKPDSAEDGVGAPGARPAALNVEMRPPQSSVARGLHLGPGEPAITVTIRFDESSGPVALTVVMLRPDLFKVSIETAISPTD